ncbi:MAG TPA: hypothetical protein DD670_16915 [Planctomycetaceae bacterium]|nr:hypothetical protein [Planctomycetaceae bacterium]
MIDLIDRISDRFASGRRFKNRSATGTVRVRGRSASILAAKSRLSDDTNGKDEFTARFPHEPIHGSAKLNVGREETLVKREIGLCGEFSCRLHAAFSSQVAS